MKLLSESNQDRSGRRGLKRVYPETVLHLIMEPRAGLNLSLFNAVG